MQKEGADFVRNVSRSTSVVALTLGAVAVICLLGWLHGLPPVFAFGCGAPAMLLFPGAALAALAPSAGRHLSLPEKLALWFVLGTGLLAVCGFTGLAVHARVSHLLVGLTAIYASLMVLIALRLPARRRPLAELEHAGDHPSGQLASGRARAILLVLLFAIAVGAGLLTLVTPRDVDDWYYLAYIRDFASDHPLRSEDAILDMGHTAPPRIWYASWWVVEALLSRATGVDPVPCHQVYLPVLIASFSVLAVFTLARQVFPSEKAALVASFLQVLFYLSGAYPQNNAGWMVFCRTSQDKAFACFTLVPVAVGLALRLMKERGPDRRPAAAPCPDGVPSGALALSVVASDNPVVSPAGRWIFGLYGFAVVTSILVHPLALVWISLATIPLALIEALRERSRGAVITTAALMLPTLVSGALLVSGIGKISNELTATALKQAAAARQTEATRGETREAKTHGLAGAEEEAEEPTDRQDQTAPRFGAFYLPGSGFPWVSSEGNYGATLRRRGQPIVANPLYVTRFPLAVAGLVLTPFLFLFVRKSFSARFLVSLTLATLLFTFVPTGATLSARVLTWKMVYRLTWMLPWGLTIGFFLGEIRLRGVPHWVEGLGPAVVTLALALALARGNPENYVKSMFDRRVIARPQREEVDALGFLRTQPSPQGVVLASAVTSRMIPAFVADASPASYPGAGTMASSRRDELLHMNSLTPAAVDEIRQAQCKYILIEKGTPFAISLGKWTPGDRDVTFQLLYTNPKYEIWRIVGRTGGD